MKNHIDSNFAIAIIALVAACVGFSFAMYNQMQSYDVYFPDHGSYQLHLSDAESCAYDDPEKIYSEKDRRVCEDLELKCSNGAVGFYDRCGCGCQVMPSEPMEINMDIPRTEQQCILQNGTWGIFGHIQGYQCDLPTADAGKICSDSSECESICIGQVTETEALLIGGDEEFVIERNGTCGATQFSDIGCHPEVVEGRISQIMCVD